MNASKKILEEILSELRLNSKQFADNIGVSPQSIYDIINNGRDISRNMADKIISKYPYFSRTYILAGEGGLMDINNNDLGCDLSTKRTLENISEALLNNSKANVIFAESFNRLTRTFDKYIDILGQNKNR